MKVNQVGINVGTIRVNGSFDGCSSLVAGDKTRTYRWDACPRIYQDDVVGRSYIVRPAPSEVGSYYVGPEIEVVGIRNYPDGEIEEETVFRGMTSFVAVRGSYYGEDAWTVWIPSGIRTDSDVKQAEWFVSAPQEEAERWARVATVACCFPSGEWLMRLGEAAYETKLEELTEVLREEIEQRISKAKLGELVRAARGMRIV